MSTSFVPSDGAIWRTCTTTTGENERTLQLLFPPLETVAVTRRKGVVFIDDDATTPSTKDGRNTRWGRLTHRPTAPSTVLTNRPCHGRETRG